MGRIKLVAPQFTKEAREALSVLYPAITGGLQGEGLTPKIDAATRSRLLKSLRTEFPETRRELGSFISRTIPRADIGVRGFLKKSLAAQFARQKESIGREFEFRGFEDLPRAQNLAFGALASEKGIASNFANIMNESTMRRAGAPDFGETLFGGLGTAAGIALAEQGQGGGVNFRNALAGSNYSRNFSSSDFTTPVPIRYAEGFSNFKR